MKKIYTLIFAALVLAASCTPSVEPDGEGNPPIGQQQPIVMKSYVLTATKDANTKVSVTDDNEAVWQSTDKIIVFNTAWRNEGYEAKLISGENTAEATFEFEAPEERNSGFFVVYGATATLTNDNLNIIVPSEVKNSAAPILAGYTSSNTGNSIGSVDLKAVCAYMKFTLTDAADAVRFFPVNNPTEKFAGTITYNADGEISTTSSESQVVVSSPSQEFFVNLLPGDLSKGYIIDVEKDGAHMIKSVSYGSKYENLKTGSFGKITIPTFVAVSGISAEVSAKTTYSQATGTSKNLDTTGEGANNTANTNKIWGCSAPLTSVVQNISNTLKDNHLKPIFYCDNKQTPMPNGELDKVAQGQHTVLADYAFICGDVTIPLASVTPTVAHITGLPVAKARPTDTTWPENNNVDNWNYGTTGGTGVLYGTNGYIQKSFHCPGDITIALRHEGKGRKGSLTSATTMSLSIGGVVKYTEKITDTSANGKNVNFDVTGTLTNNKPSVRCDNSYRNAVSTYFFTYNIEIKYSN